MTAAGSAFRCRSSLERQNFVEIVETEAADIAIRVRQAEYAATVDFAG